MKRLYGSIGWILLVFAGVCAAQDWRTEPLSPMDQQYMESQQQALNGLASRHLGRQLNGTADNDLTILQRLLDEGVVQRDQVELLQAMGIILGQLLKQEEGLVWVAYYDKLGRSRSLQVPGKEKEFIFPVTQISRRAEVGLKVDVRAVYRELQQAVVDIRNKPLL